MDTFACEDPLINRDFALEGLPFFQLFRALRGCVGKDEISQTLVSRFELSHDDANELVAELRERGVLVDENDDAFRCAQRSKALWDRYGWSNAFYFHLAVRNYPFLDYALPGGRAPDFEKMREYLRTKGLPDKYKAYNEPVTPLAKPEEDTRLGANLKRYFEFAPPEGNPGSLDAETLGKLLWLVVGQVGKKPWPDQGYFVRKTSPSGGARHPTEAYVAVLDIEGLQPGIYHYNVKEHGFDPLPSSDGWRDQLVEAAPDLRSRLSFEPRVVLFFSTIAERSMWRYRDSRSYRVLLVDLGHVLATLRMVCSAKKRSLFLGQGIHEEKVERLLGLDGLDETALYVGAIA